jgi:hypothetical protein
MHKFLKFILEMKLCMFRTVPVSIIGSFSLYTQQWYMSYRFADSLRAGSGWNILILLPLGQTAKVKHVLVIIGFYTGEWLCQVLVLADS